MGSSPLRRNALQYSVTMPRSELIRRLSLKRVTDVRYYGDAIALTFDGRRIVNKVKIVPHEERVESYTVGSRVITIDNDAPRRYRPALSVHGSVEKYVVETYGLTPDEDAHQVTQAVEKTWFTENFPVAEWDIYDKTIVGLIHAKEAAHQRTLGEFKELEPAVRTQEKNVAEYQKFVESLRHRKPVFEQRTIGGKRY